MTDDYFGDYDRSYAQDYGGTTKPSNYLANPGGALATYFNHVRTRAYQPVNHVDEAIARLSGTGQSGASGGGPQGGSAVAAFQPAGPPVRFSANLLGSGGQDNPIMGIAGSPVGQFALGTPGQQRGGAIDVGPFDLATTPVNMMNFATYAREGSLAAITSVLGNKYQQGADGQTTGPQNTDDLFANMGQGDWENVLDNIGDAVNQVGKVVQAPLDAYAMAMRENAARSRGQAVRDLVRSGGTLGDATMHITSLFDQSKFSWSGISEKAAARGISSADMLAELWNLDPAIVAAIGANPNMTDEELDQLVKNEPYSYDPGVNLIAELGINLVPVLAGAWATGGATAAIRGSAALGRIGEITRAGQTIGRGLTSAEIATYVGRPAALAERIGSWSLQKAWRTMSSTPFRVAGAVTGVTPTGIKIGAGIRFGEWALKQTAAIAGNEEAVRMMDEWLWEMPLSNNPGLNLIDAFALHPMEGAKIVARSARHPVATAGRIGGALDDFAVRVAGRTGVLPYDRITKRVIASIADMDLPVIHERIGAKLAWDKADLERLYGPDSATGLSVKDLLNGLYHIAREVVRDDNATLAKRLEVGGSIIERDEAFHHAYGPEALKLLKAELDGSGTKISDAIREEFWHRSNLIEGSDLGKEGAIGPYLGPVALQRLADWTLASKRFRGIADEAMVPALRNDVNLEFLQTVRADLKARFKPGDVIDAPTLNSIQTYIPTSIFDESGLLRGRARVPHVSRRQLEAILDRLERGQSRIDELQAGPRTAAAPVIAVADVGSTKAAALAFRVRQETIVKLEETLADPTLATGAIPRDLEAGISERFPGVTEAHIRADPAAYWPEVVEWYGRMKESAAARGEAIAAIDRFAQHLDSRTREGASDAEALLRIKQAIGHPYSAAEIKSNQLLQAIVDQRDEALTGFIDRMSAWLDSPLRKMKVRQLTDGKRIMLETDGFGPADVELLENALERYGRSNLDLNPLLDSTLMNVDLHPLEKVAALQAATDAGLKLPGAQMTRLMELKDLEGTYGAMVNEAYPGSPVNKAVIDKLTNEVANSSDELASLRVEARGLAGLIDRAPSQQISSELTQARELGRSLGATSVGAGAVEVPHWTNLPIEPAGVIRAQDDSARAALRASADRDVASKQSVFDHYDRLASRATSLKGKKVAAADYLFDEANPVGSFPTKKAAMDLARDLQAGGLASRVEKVGSRWKVLRGELTPEAAARTAAQKELDAVLAGKDAIRADMVAEAQAANLAVSAERGGTVESGGAMKPNAPKLSTEEWIAQQHELIAAKTARVDELAVLAEQGGMSWRKPDGGLAIISRDGRPDSAGWRMTLTMADGTPTGHMEAKTAAEAIRLADNLVDLSTAPETAAVAPDAPLVAPEPGPIGTGPGGPYTQGVKGSVFHSLTHDAPTAEIAAERTARWSEATSWLLRDAQERGLGTAGNVGGYQPRPAGPIPAWLLDAAGNPEYPDWIVRTLREFEAKRLEAINRSGEIAMKFKHNEAVYSKKADWKAAEAEKHDADRQIRNMLEPTIRQREDLPAPPPIVEQISEHAAAEAAVNDSHLAAEAERQAAFREHTARYEQDRAVPVVETAPAAAEATGAPRIAKAPKPRAEDAIANPERLVKNEYGVEFYIDDTGVLQQVDPPTRANQKAAWKAASAAAPTVPAVTTAAARWLAARLGDGDHRLRTRIEEAATFYEQKLEVARQAKKKATAEQWKAASDAHDQVLEPAMNEARALLFPEGPGLFDQQTFGEAGAAAETPRTLTPAPVEVTFLDPADNKTPVRSRVVLVDADAVLTSDQIGFPANLQPRSRDVRKGSDVQITKMAKDLEPSLLLGVERGSDGMPIVTPEGAVLAGNGRTAAVRLANDAVYARYRAAMTEVAPQYGFDPAVIATMKRPMFVRELVDVDPVQQTRLAWQLNDMPLGDRATALASAISREDLRQFQISDEQTLGDALRSERNGAAVARMLSHMGQDAVDKSIYFDARTGLNAEGVKLLEGALIAKLLRADDRSLPNFAAARDVVLQIAEQEGEDIRRLTGGMLEAAGQIIKVQERADQGLTGPEINRLSDDLGPALRRIMEFRAEGETLGAIADLMGSPRMWAADEAALNPIQEHLGRVLSLSSSQRDVRTFLRAVARAADAEGEAGLLIPVEKLDYVGVLNEGIDSWNNARVGKRQLDHFPNENYPYDTPLTPGRANVDGTSTPPIVQSQPLAAEELGPAIAARTLGEEVHAVAETIDQLPEGASASVLDPNEAVFIEQFVDNPEAVRADIYDAIANAVAFTDETFPDYFAGLVDEANAGTIRPGDWYVVRHIAGSYPRRNKKGELNSPHRTLTLQSLREVRAANIDDYVDKLLQRGSWAKPEGAATVLRPHPQKPLSAEEFAEDVGPDVPHDATGPVVDALVNTTGHVVTTNENPGVARAVRKAAGVNPDPGSNRAILEFNAPDATVQAERLSGLRQQALAALTDAQEKRARAETDPIPGIDNVTSVFPDNQPELRDYWDRLMRSGLDEIAAAIGSVEPRVLSEIDDAIQSIDRGMIVDPVTGVGLTMDEAAVLRSYLMRLMNGSLETAIQRKTGRKAAAFAARVKPVDDFALDDLQDRARAIMDDVSSRIVRDPNTPALEGWEGTQYIPSPLPKHSKAAPGEPLPPRLLLRDLFTDSAGNEIIPGLTEELQIGRMETVARRIDTARATRLIDHVIGPRPEKEIQRRAIENFTNEIGKIADFDNLPVEEVARINRVVEQTFADWRDAIEQNKLGPYQLKRKISQLGPEQMNRIFDAAVDKVYAGHPPTWVADMAASRTSAAKMWRKADNRLRNYIRESGMPMSEGIERLYGRAADLGTNPGTFIVNWYNGLRFLGDIRWMGLEAVEPAIYALTMGGIKPFLKGNALTRPGGNVRPNAAPPRGPIGIGKEGQGKMWMDFSHFAGVVSDIPQRNGARMRYLMLVMESKQKPLFRDAVIDMAKREPELVRMIREQGDNAQSYVERLDRDWSLAEQGTRKFDTAAEAEQAFKPWLDGGFIDQATFDSYVKARQYSVHPAIEAELNKVVGDPIASALYTRLATINQQLFHDLTQTFFGQTDRSNLQRLANHPLVYWPVSYQIKATKWLLNFMLDSSFGIDTGATTGVVMQRVWDAQMKRIQTDPDYRARLQENKTLFFLASMLLPMSPVDIGVSLSPFTRMALDRDYGRGLFSFGPFYTVKALGNLVAEQSKPDQFFGPGNPLGDVARQLFPQTITVGAKRSTKPLEQTDALRAKIPTSTTEAEAQRIAGQNPTLLPDIQPSYPRLP